jgi:hypothetical protein
LFRHLSGGTEESHGNPVEIAGASDEIQTEYFQHTDLEPYPYTIQ